MIKMIALEETAPPENTFLLIRRASGMTNTPYEYLTAQFNPSYKGWSDVHNERLTDNVSFPTHWARL